MSRGSGRAEASVVHEDERTLANSWASSRRRPGTLRWSCLTSATSVAELEFPARTRRALRVPQPASAAASRQSRCGARAINFFLADGVAAGQEVFHVPCSHVPRRRIRDLDIHPGTRVRPRARARAQQRRRLRQPGCTGDMPALSAWASVLRRLGHRTAVYRARSEARRCLAGDHPGRSPRPRAGDLHRRVVVAEHGAPSRGRTSRPRRCAGASVVLVDGSGPPAMRGHRGREQIKGLRKREHCRIREARPELARSDSSVSSGCIGPRARATARSVCAVERHPRGVI